MKNLLLLLVAVVSLSSCSNDESSNSITNSTLLQRVDFFPNTSNERRWNFNQSGFLTSITKADGTLVERYVYDSNGNVIELITNENGNEASFVIQYDSNGIISKINTTDYSFNSNTRTYSYTNGDEYFSCTINDDGLFTNLIIGNSSAQNTFENNYQATYQNGNITNFSNNGTTVETLSKTFQNSTVKNPMLNGIKAVLKVKSLLDPTFFADGVSSKMIAENVALNNQNKHIEAGLLINRNDNVESVTWQYFEGNTYVSAQTFAQFYYQGDVLP
jgi:YD repeat-containing protein